MPSSKFGSKFFGERYQQYVDELTAEGTIDGEKLSPTERKEGFKKRKDKVDFEKFVEKVISKKKSAAPSMSGRRTSLGGGGGGAIVKAQRVSAGKIVPQQVGEETKENMDEILKGIDSILNSLREQENIKKKQLKLQRRTTEKRKRKASEDKLEGGIFKGLVKATDKVLKPVKGLFERVFDFIKTVILGRVIMKLLDWMGDSDNRKKLTAIGKFLSKTWPALLFAYLAFGNGLGRFITKMILMTLKFIPKIAMTIAKLAAAHPLAAAAIAGAGLFVAGAVIPKLMPGTVDEQERKTAAEPGTAEEKIKKLEEQKSKLNFLERMQGVGAEIDEQIKFLETGKTAAYSGGGIVRGFAGGGHAMAHGTDTVPAMLTPGEFVMSRGAVQKYGSNTLAAMNAAGGGTNRPTMLDGTLYAKTGGHVHAGPDTEPAKENRQSAEKQPEVPAGDFDPAAISAALSKQYPDVEVPNTAVTTPTITGPTQSGNVEAEKDVPLQLTGTSKERVGTDKAFLEGLVEMSKRLGVNPGDMLAKMASESSLMPNAQHPDTLATGLIQMLPSTAREQGTTIEALKGMSRAEQLPFIEKYLNKKLSGVERPISPGHLYTATFLPAFVKEKEDFVLASRDGSLPKGYPQSKQWYAGNAGLDVDSDGRIQIFELGARLAKIRKDFGIGGGISKGGLHGDYDVSDTSNINGGGGGGATEKPKMSDADQIAFATGRKGAFDYNKIREQIGTKTSSVSRSSRPSSTAAYQEQLQSQQGQQGQPSYSDEKTGKDVPQINADAMISQQKIQVLGIAV
jgi:hypothetical protein